MTVIHNQDAKRDAIGSEIILHQLPPALLFALGDLGKAVAGQIHQVALSVQREVIHMNGLARLIPYPCKILALEQAVDDRGFTHIGFACKGNLRQTVGGEILWGRGRN